MVYVSTMIYTGLLRIYIDGPRITTDRLLLQMNLFIEITYHTIELVSSKYACIL